MAYIMIVEDDADTNELLCQVLHKAGHAVKGVPNGKDALQLILAQIPDMVILDMFMPDMDGAGLLEILRSYLRLGSLPVIVYTGLPESPLAERARHLRVNAILIKGKATFEDIVQTVNQELARAPR
jgi:CheY-like chemotaxis protein